MQPFGRLCWLLSPISSLFSIQNPVHRWWIPKWVENPTSQGFPGHWSYPTNILTNWITLLPPKLFQWSKLNLKNQILHQNAQVFPKTHPAIKSLQHTQNTFNHSISPCLSHPLWRLSFSFDINRLPYTLHPSFKPDPESWFIPTQMPQRSTLQNTLTN